MKIKCIKCLKDVAEGKVRGITTWFAVCSECLYGVKGWTKEDFKKEIQRKSKRFAKVRGDEMTISNPDEYAKFLDSKENILKGITPENSPTLKLLRKLKKKELSPKSSKEKK